MPRRGCFCDGRLGSSPLPPSASYPFDRSPLTLFFSDDARKGFRNGATHRILSVVATDINLFHILCSSTALADEVSKWESEFQDRGASIYYRMCRYNGTYMVPGVRWELLAFVVAQSPKLRYICRLLHDCLFPTDGGKRTKIILFTNWPLEQWLLAFFLDLLGINTVEIKSSMNLDQKQALMDDFNNPQMPISVLLTSFKACSVGVNLHRDCHKVCMLGMPENVNTLLQAIGRVHRLGQKEDQLIWILGLDHSYDQWIQAKVARKFRAQVLGEASLKHKTWEEEELVQLEADFRLTCTPQRPFSQAGLEAHQAKLEDEFLNEQADKLIASLIGFRSNRKGWDTVNLYAKDSEPVYSTTPRKVQRFHTSKLAAAGEGEDNGEIEPPSSPTAHRGPRPDKTPDLASSAAPEPGEPVVDNGDVEAEDAEMGGVDEAKDVEKGSVDEAEDVEMGSVDEAGGVDATAVSGPPPTTPDLASSATPGPTEPKVGNGDAEMS